MTNSNLFFRRVPVLVAVIASMAAATALPAFAQDNHVQRYGEKDKEESATEKAAKKDAERAYQRSLGNIPTQKATDPWGTMRSEEAPKAAAKPVAAKPKAKSATADSKTGAAAKQ